MFSHILDRPKTYLVVDGARSALDGDVGAEIEVKLEGVSAARLHQRTWQGVAVAIALASVRKEADMVALAGDDDGELGHLLAAQLGEDRLHVMHLLGQDSSVLALGDAVTDVEDALRRLALADALDPVLGHVAKVVLNVGRRDHLDAVAVGLHLSPIFDEVGIRGNSYGSERGSLTRAGAGCRVRDVGTDNHGGCRGGFGSDLWDQQALGDTRGAAHFCV